MSVAHISYTITKGNLHCKLFNQQCISSTSAGSTGARSIGAGNSSVVSTGAGSTCAGSSCARRTGASAVMINKNGREIKTVNKNGIYAVLSRIWKCCKSRVFGANFLGKKIGRC